MQAYAQETLTSERFRSDEATVRVTLLDVNDNSPVFSQSQTYLFLVNATAPTNTLIGQVRGKSAECF